MSEDKPTFKVTDRRLFNPDGSPRDIEREDRAPETPAAIPTQPAPSAAPAPTPSADAAPRPSAAPQAATAEPSAPGETDPLFVELMMFVAENAAAMLSGHPQFGGEVNLPYAQQFIEMLAALRTKTTGRLSFEEQNTLDTLLTQLRMQYVQKSTPRPTSPSPSPGGFTGGDITGGR